MGEQPPPGADVGVDAAPDIYRETPLRYLGYASEDPAHPAPLLVSPGVMTATPSPPSPVVSTADPRADEVGEAFKSLVSRLSYRLSYALSIGYVAADALDKGLRAARGPGDHGRGAAHGDASPSPAAAVADTVLWQGLASVAIPGLAINRAVWGAARALQAAGASPGAVRAVPTAVGLGLIPFIVQPIDHAVEEGMDRFVRPALFPPGGGVAAVVAGGGRAG